MADKKDLSEAQSYSRRRLVTAFTSGIPEGVELTPKKNQTPVIVGVGLTVIAVLISMFYGIISPSLPSGWENNKLIVAKSSAARYVSSKGTLHPVINAISARLLIPSSDFKVITVDDDQLAGIPIGSTIGILGAPDSLPDQDGLVTGSINSCTSEQGTDTTASNEQANTQASHEAALVSVDDADYLVTGSQRYKMPSEPTLRDAYLRALGIPQITAIKASAQWINLFEHGDEMAPIAINDEGKEMNIHGVNVPVGGVVMQQGDSKHGKYVVMTDGSLSPLDDLAYDLYVIGKPEQLTRPRTLNASEFQHFTNSAAPAIPSNWPNGTLTAKRHASSACATYPLRASKKAASSQARLTVKESSDPSTTIKRSGSVKIKDGAGALVRATIGSSDDGTVFAIDSTGTAYPIPNASEETLKRLGYSSKNVRNIPRSWIDVFPQGVQLTAEAAGSPPTAPETSDDSDGTSDSDASATPKSMTTDAVIADGQGQCQAGVENYVTQQPWTNTLFDIDTLRPQSTGKGVTVAVIDSGVDVNNPHLADAVVPGTSYLDSDDSNGMADTYSHGTAVAGIIAARDVQGSSVHGLAPEASIMPIRVFESIREENGRQTGAPSLETVGKAIRYAVDHHAQIINISLSDTRDDPQMQASVRYAESNGSLIVASAGNRLTSTSTKDGLRYPAAYDGVVGVTAVDVELNATEDSVHGSQVDIAAPGMMTASTIPGGVDCVFATDVSSTSFATAYASAEAALIASRYPDETPAQWRQRMFVSANRARSDQRDDKYGWGVMDPQSALALSLSDDLRGPKLDGTTAMQHRAGVSGKPLVLHAQHDPDANVKLFAGIISIVVLCVCATAWLLARYRRETNQKKTGGRFSTSGRE
ncbi:type VII secretion protein EccB [Bifidobacterium ruminantium]|uniref:type VII secretion protein EccB n=1 Tax=Bifidobacterium ruminantium TaxID=78346 RepID=UPI00249336AD|nr:type VII secretion protein EccB [Bifidobacterium ruminantium]